MAYAVESARDIEIPLGATASGNAHNPNLLARGQHDMTAPVHLKIYGAAFRFNSRVEGRLSADATLSVYKVNGDKTVAIARGFSNSEQPAPLSRYPYKVVAGNDIRVNALGIFYDTSKNHDNSKLGYFIVRREADIEIYYGYIVREKVGDKLHWVIYHSDRMDKNEKKRVIGHHEMFYVPLTTESEYCNSDYYDHSTDGGLIKQACWQETRKLIAEPFVRGQLVGFERRR